VLLVDDEEGIRNVLGITLRDAGYTLLTADNGISALDIFKKHLPDIVLTDVRMPGKSGMELLKDIKQIRPETEVVMITGHGDMKLAIESLKMDAVDFIPKPIDQDILEIALKRAHEKIEVRKKITAYTENLEEMVREKTAELETSKRRYIQLFNESPTYITIQDRNLDIVETNKLFREHFRTGERLSCYQSYRDRNTPCPGCPVLKTFEDGRTHSAEMDVKTRDGNLKHILIQTSPVTDEKGDIQHVMEMSTDITVIRRLQEHLASLGLHISSISHGIKGLLTGLDGGSYMLESGLKKQDPELTSDGWEIVKTKISDIRKMTLDILQHSKKREIVKTKLSLKSFMEHLASDIRPSMKAHRIIFCVNYPEEAIEIHIDKVGLSAALMNVLENAVDACSQSSKKESGQIQFSAEKTGNEIRFKIHDNGVGIPADKMERVFTLFHSNKGNQGTGLGLFITEKSVKDHDGLIDINSEVGKFTEFIMTLPIL